MTVSPAREALNTPVTSPRIAAKAAGLSGHVAYSAPGDRFAFRRTPNYTGQGSHKFAAWFAFVPADGSDWRGNVEVFQLTPDGAAFPRFETAVIRAGRMLPENQLADVRAAAIEAYKQAFPWSDAVEFGAWAARQGIKVHCDSAGTWGRIARADGAGFRYRGDVGDSRETLACLVEDIRAGEAAPDPVAAPYKAPACFVCGNTAPHGLCDPADIARTVAALPAPVAAPARDWKALAYAEGWRSSSRGGFENVQTHATELDCEDGDWQGLCELWGIVPPADVPAPVAAAPAPVAAAPAPVAAPSKVRVIDMTPTWAGLLPALVEVAANGTSAKGRADAMGELMRLARIADKAVADAKAAEGLSDGPAGAPRPAAGFASFKADEPAALVNLAAVSGPSDIPNPGRVRDLTRIEAAACVWAYSRLFAAIGGINATEGPEGWNVTTPRGRALWFTRESVANAVAAAKAVPPLAPVAAVPAPVAAPSADAEALLTRMEDDARAPGYVSVMRVQVCWAAWGDFAYTVNRDPATREQALAALSADLAA